MKRKIIQIQHVPETDTEYNYLIALCNDGSIWYLESGKWRPETRFIPQNEIDEYGV